MKTAGKINLKLEHIHFRQTAAQNSVFNNNEIFTFYFNNSTSFGSVFCMNIVESTLFIKYLKRMKSQAWFCLSLGCQWKKYLENCNSVGARTHKVGKVWPNLDSNFADIWRA